MTCAYLFLGEIKYYYYILIAKTLYENSKWVSIWKAGEKFLDKIDNMHFWGTPKNQEILKHVNEST